MDLARFSESVSPPHKKRVRLSLKSHKSKQYPLNLFPEFHSSFPVISDSPKTRNPRITLPAPKKHLHGPLNQKLCSEHTQESEGVERPDQYSKLIQIRSRCINCYGTFIEERDREKKMVKETFTEIHRSLDESFDAIMDEVKAKHRELKQFLKAQQNQLLMIRDIQQTPLKQNFTSINEVHLQELLKSNITDSEQQLCDYAKMLHKFYATMLQVSKVNFEENAKEAVRFAEDFIRQQILGVRQRRVFAKDRREANTSFSFNDYFGNVIDHAGEENQKKTEPLSNCLSADKQKEMIEGEAQTLEISQGISRESGDILCEITNKQKILSHKINSYKELVSKCYW